jgi:cyanophycinase-like exopeptidase
MNGSLALVGSGEYLPQMAEFEKSLIDDGVKNGKKPIYIQIPTAAGRESESRLNHWRDLGAGQAEKIGVESIFLPIYDRDGANNQEYADQIRGSALVYFSGGDPHYLADSLVDTPVWKAVYENYLTGGSIAGCSAGAMVLSSHIPNFRLSKSEPTVGLNLIPQIRVIPHFDKFFRWIPESAAKILLNIPTDGILIGIDELTALTKRSNLNIWQVSGKAKVHILKGLAEQQLAAGDEISF